MGSFIYERQFFALSFSVLCDVPCGKSGCYNLGYFGVAYTYFCHGFEGFLGLTSFYRRFVRHYATIASPITDLLKSTTFSWSPATTQAFETLKMAMSTLPVLALPDFSSTFEVTIDASTVAIGAVLSQQDHRIAFFSKKMFPHMRSSSTYIQELYDITEAVKKWRQYLLGQTFKIYTDHKSIKNIMNQTIQTTEQQKWLTKLMGYCYEIHYKPGKQNMVVDALSRVVGPEPPSVFAAVCSPSFPFIEQLRKFFSEHPAGQKFMSRIQNELSLQQKFHSKSGLIYFGEHIFIPTESQLVSPLLTKFHYSPIEGHSGIKGTLARISTSFYWPGIYRDVKQFVNQCSVCQQSKYSTHSPYGLLQPLPIPNHVWEDTATYELNLPSSVRIHPIFHVSLLKPCLGQPDSQVSPLPV